MFTTPIQERKNLNSRENAYSQLLVILFIANDVYDGDTEKVIENCRVICDLKSAILKRFEKGSVMVGLKEEEMSEMQ